MTSNIIRFTDLPAEAIPTSSIVVVLDVFRASNTIMALLMAGADRVYLLSRVERAFALKRQKPHALLLGERKGQAIAGMQGGNSPALARQMRLAGQEVILTTSAGTQPLARLQEAYAVVYGSFANAGALTAYLWQQARDVLFLPMGLEAREPALEDDLAATYLQKLLLGQNVPDFAQISQQLLHCPGARRLRGLNQHNDLQLCSSLNTMPVIPLVDYHHHPPCAHLSGAITKKPDIVD